MEIMRKLMCSISLGLGKTSLLGLLASAAFLVSCSVVRDEVVAKRFRVVAPSGEECATLGVDDRGNGIMRIRDATGRREIECAFHPAVTESGIITVATLTISDLDGGVDVVVSVADGWGEAAIETLDSSAGLFADSNGARVYVVGLESGSADGVSGPAISIESTKQSNKITAIGRDGAEERLK